MSLYTSEHFLRVRYGETDQMGYVYYGNYAEYFEVARVEMLRELGVPYQQLEESGVILPVYDLHVRYKRPATYDEMLCIRTELLECTATRVKFSYAVYNEAKVLLNEAETTLVFVDKATGKPTRAPRNLLDALKLP